MPTEWTKGPVFAEVAETLGVPTSQILAMMPNSEQSTSVLFTPVEGEEDVWCAALRRDRDGILVEHYRIEVPNFVEDLRAKLEKGKPDA